MNFNETNHVRVGNGSGDAKNTIDPSETMFLVCNLQDVGISKIVLRSQEGVLQYLLQPWVHELPMLIFCILETGATHSSRRENTD